MGDITNIKEVELPVNQHLVDQLEGLLANAKSGKIVGLASAAIWEGGTYISTGWSLKQTKGPEVVKIIGSLDLLKYRLIKMETEIAEAGDEDSTP